MGKILVIGLSCIDLMNYVEKYPEEDSDTRIFEQSTNLGGNATNACTVFSKFSPDEHELFASIPKGDMLLESLIKSYKINLRRIERENSTVPFSNVIVNKTNGSRTILHFRGDLPELTVEEFIKEYPNFDDYSWVHFEGRNFKETPKMIEHIRKHRNPNATTISLELEKIREYAWYEKFIHLVDLLFMSKDLAKHLGFMSMVEAVDGLLSKYNLEKTTVIVPWGEMGVAARQGKSGRLIQQSAFPPPKLVDTLAAGDTFVAAAIHYLNKGRPLEEALEKACKLAGQKCGQQGLLNLDVSIL